MHLDFRLPGGLTEYTFSMFIRSCHEGTPNGLQPTIQTHYSWDSCHGTISNGVVVEPGPVELDSTGSWVSGNILTIPADLTGVDAGHHNTRFAQLGLWVVHLSCSAPVVFTIAGNTIELPAGPHKFTIDGKANTPYMSIQSNPEAHVSLAVWVALPYRFFNRIDTNIIMQQGGGMGDARSNITNHFKHFTVRVKLDKEQMKHLYTTTFDNVDLTESLPRVIDEFAYPPRVHMTMGNRTLFQLLTLLDALTTADTPFQLFDFNFFPLWLSDKSIEALHESGFRELVRRNIPLQWSPP